jgi:hypothetical protein
MEVPDFLLEWVFEAASAGENDRVWSVVSVENAMSNAVDRLWGIVNWPLS